MFERRAHLRLGVAGQMGSRHTSLVSPKCPGCGAKRRRDERVRYSMPCPCPPHVQIPSFSIPAGKGHVEVGRLHAPPCAPASVATVGAGGGGVEMMSKCPMFHVSTQQERQMKVGVAAKNADGWRAKCKQTRVMMSPRPIFQFEKN